MESNKNRMVLAFIAVSIVTILLLSGCSKDDHIQSVTETSSPDNVVENSQRSTESYDFTTIFHEKIKGNMPEFAFELFADFDESMNGYSLEKLTITDASSGKIIQDVYIPELTLFGRTNIPINSEETMGFELEDLNFDGYQDVRLLDTDNGQYLVEWIYLVWNPVKHLFEHNSTLNEIPLATFDQDKQLVYGTDTYSADDHHFSTYKYINGVPTLIRYYSKEFLGSKIGSSSIEEYMKYPKRANINIGSDNFLIFHETVSVLNEKTDKLETTSDEYVFYTDSNEPEIIARFDVLDS